MKRNEIVADLIAAGWVDSEIVHKDNLVGASRSIENLERLESSPTWSAEPDPASDSFREWWWVAE